MKSQLRVLSTGDNINGKTTYSNAPFYQHKSKCIIIWEIRKTWLDILGRHLEVVFVFHNKE